MGQGGKVIRYQRDRSVRRMMGVASMCMLVTLCSTVRAGQIRGEVELQAQQHEETQGVGGSERQYQAQEYEQILRLRQAGHLYHPNLFTYQAAVGLGLTQHHYEDDLVSRRDNGTLEEYTLTGSLLSEKAYPIRFHADKSDEIISRQFASSLLSEREDMGISMMLRSDWPMRFQVGRSDLQQSGQDNLDRDLFTREDLRYSYALDHDFSDQLGLSFDLTGNDTSQTQGVTSVDRKEQVMALSQYLLFGAEGRNRLDSLVNYLTQTGDIDMDRLLWQERLKIHHSDTFQTRYRYAYHTSQRAAQTNQEQRGEMGFTHRLYESLTTTASVSGARTDLGDEVKQTRVGGNLGWDYRKKNSWGVLSAHYGLGLLNLDQTGDDAVIAVVGETHAFTTGGSLRIRLQRPHIDRATIRVYNNNRSRLYSDYTVSQSSGITELHIQLGGDIATDGDQTLSIDYNSTTEPQRQEQSLVHSARLRQRFDWGLSAYYEYQNRSERLRATETALIPDEFEIHRLGVDYMHKGLRALAEVSDEASTRIPSRSKRVEASYMWHLKQDTRLTVYASNSWIDYTGQTTYDVDLQTIGTHGSMRLSDTLQVDGRVDYRNEQDSRQGRTRGFQWDLALKYRFRQVSARIGAEYDDLDRFNHARQASRIYVQFKRMF